MATSETMDRKGRLSGLTIVTLTALAVSNLLHRQRKSEHQALRSAEAAPPASHTPQTTGGVGAAVNGSNVVPVAHHGGLWGICRSIFDRFNRDNAMMTAAGIAFYLLVSVFPGLAALVAIYGLVGDPTEVSRQIAPFSRLLPPEAMKLLTDGLQGFILKSQGSHVSLPLVTSLALALWSSRAAMSSIMVGLTIAYEETDKRSFIVQILVSLILTVGAIMFAAVAVFSIAIVPAILALVYLDKSTEALLVYGRWPLLGAMLVLGYAVLYRFAPYRSHPRWRWISWGSAIASVLWLAGSFGFSFYVGHFGSYDATYGSLGAVVVLLLWFWVSALVMILGAEIDSELDLRDTNGGSPMAGTPPSAGPPGKPEAA